MVTLQREQNGPHSVGDRKHDATIALAELDDLAGTEVHLRPFQVDAFRLPHAGGAHEAKERRVIGTHGRVEPIGFTVLQLADDFFRLFQPVARPIRLMLEQGTLRFGEAEKSLQDFCARSVDGGRRDKRRILTALDPLAATPRDHSGNSSVIDFG